MRLATLIALAGLALAGATPSRAGETAESRILGYSEDGRLFAFEEFGIQDGSGFPYANVFVVDTDDDSWVSGTPIRVRLEDENATLPAARREAERLLHEAVGDAIEPTGAVVLAHAPLGEYEQDPTRLRFGALIPSNPLGEPATRYEARLDIFHAETETKDCMTFIGEPANGFRLHVDNLDSGNSVVLDEDTGPIPESRGCPITYRVSQVVIPEYPPERVAVLLSVFTPGFEGPDRSFIAVTGELPD